jgi:type VI protein secretion system component VasK
MEPTEVSHEQRSSITLTRSSTNQRYGWVIKLYEGSTPPAVSELSIIDNLLRATYAPELADQLETSLAAARNQRGE